MSVAPPQLILDPVDSTAWEEDPYPLYKLLRLGEPGRAGVEDPDSYRPGRDLRRHVALSYGIHYCAGAPLTRYEVTALMNELLDRYELGTRRRIGALAEHDAGLDRQGSGLADRARALAPRSLTALG